MEIIRNRQKPLEIEEIKKSLFCPLSRGASDLGSRVVTAVFWTSKMFDGRNIVSSVAKSTNTKDLRPETPEIRNQAETRPEILGLVTWLSMGLRGPPRASAGLQILGGPWRPTEGHGVPQSPGVRSPLFPPCKNHLNS